MYEPTIENLDRQRESWIDVLKGIGIILVVIGHVSQKNALNTWIYTFHMPLFFALSGYLWSRSNIQIPYKSFLVKRMRFILWPFVLFRLLLVAYWIVVESHFRPLDLGPIWFLIVLFVVEILAFFILSGSGKKSVLFSCALVITLAVVWFAMKQLLPMNTVCAWLLRCLNGLLWYLAGHLVGVFTLKTNFRLNQICKYCILMISFLVSICICRVNPGASMWSNKYGEYYLLYLVGSIVGSMFVAFFCKWLICKNSFLELLGKNTIVILATHEPIKRVILKITEILSRKNGIYISIGLLQSNILYSLAIVFAVLLVEIIVIYIFKFIKTLMPSTVQKIFLSFVR